MPQNFIIEVRRFISRSERNNICSLHNLPNLFIIYFGFDLPFRPCFVSMVHVNKQPNLGTEQQQSQWLTQKSDNRNKKQKTFME